MTLFEHAARYPQSPSWKDGDTSRKAAATIDSAQLRARCLAALDRPATADEIAVKIGESVLSVRPRFTELLALGRIEDTGTRRRNSSGRSAKVWKAT